MKEFTLEETFPVSAKSFFDMVWGDVSFQKFWHEGRGDTGVEASDWVASDKDGYKERLVKFKSPVKGEFLRKLAGKQHTDVEEKQIINWKSETEFDIVATVALDVPMKENIKMTYFWTIRGNGDKSCTAKDRGVIEFKGMWALQGTIEGVMSSESVESHTSLLEMAKVYVQKELDKLGPSKPAPTDASGSAVEKQPEDENTPESILTRIQNIEKSIDAANSNLAKAKTSTPKSAYGEFFNTKALPHLPSTPLGRVTLMIFVTMSIFPAVKFFGYIFEPADIHAASFANTTIAALLQLAICIVGYVVLQAQFDEKLKTLEQQIEQGSSKIHAYEKQLLNSASNVLASDQQFELDIAQKEIKYRMAQIDKAKTTIERQQKKIDTLHSSLTKRNQQIQNQMDTVSKIIDLNKEISECTIEQLNPQHKDKTGLELVEISNRLIERCIESGRVLLDQCQDEVAQAMTTMFLENAGLRKCNNDYVEELIRSSVEKNERFEHEFRGERSDSQGTSSADAQAYSWTCEKISELEKEDTKKYPRPRSHSVCLPLQYKELHLLHRFGALRQKPNIPLWRREALLPLNYTNIIDEYDATEFGSKARISTMRSSGVSSPFPIHIDGTGGEPIVKKQAPQPNQMEGDRFFRELFGLPSSETVVEYFSCVNSSLLHGYLYVTPRYICFDTLLFAGGNNKVVFPLTKISKVRKAKFANILPNALEFILETGETHFFSGFISRNDAYKFIGESINQVLASSSSTGGAVAEVRPVDQIKAMIASQAPTQQPAPTGNVQTSVSSAAPTLTTTTTTSATPTLSISTVAAAEAQKKGSGNETPRGKEAERSVDSTTPVKKVALAVPENDPTGRTNSMRKVSGRINLVDKLVGGRRASVNPTTFLTLEEDEHKPSTGGAS
eukprot:TRINITY_DN2077_c0_g2_i1.p1 TRINITY_DN2077_c0_g2~~TRINITY_DN2077_c0_g2_i1.p1  ORF type:complete len:899 (-),score=220.14 TRINITY_DN2077_c0_g2_i1:547-3243(-)